MGREGRIFGMYKFRTMQVGADAKGPGITASGDDRITKIGLLLRRWKLDELPQFLNVIRGEMSIVGPRPEDPKYLPAYTAEQRQVLSVRPGITGPTQIAFRHEERMLQAPDVEDRYTTQLLPMKLKMDLEYVQDRSISKDLKVIARTVAGIFVPEPEPVA